MSLNSRPIKVLRIINRFNLGGPTFNVAYLSKYMGEPFETKLIGGMKDDSEASSDFILKSVGLTPEYIPNMKRSISPKYDLEAYQHIAKVIQEYKPDIVHTHASKAGTLGRLAAINNSVPIILHTFHGHVFHSYFGKLQTLFYKTIERYLAKNSTRIIAISEKQKLELGEEHGICDPAKIEIVPLGFDLSRFTENQEEKRKQFRSKYGLTNDQVAVSIVGRLVPVKNHHFFLDVVKELDEVDRKQAVFFIVGDGESKDELISYTKQLGLNYKWCEKPDTDTNIVFTSWIKEVDQVVAGSEIICLTSLNEGTPVSLIEAQAGSRPVISTKVGGIRDIVVVDQSAFLTNTTDTIGFKTYLSKLINNKYLRQEMGVIGRNHVLEKYSFQRLIRDMEKLYTKLIEETKAA